MSETFFRESKKAQSQIFFRTKAKKPKKGLLLKGRKRNCKFWRFNLHNNIYGRKILYLFRRNFMNIQNKPF